MEEGCAGGERGRAQQSATTRKGDVLQTYEQEEQGFFTHKREEQRLTCTLATKGGTAIGRRPAMQLR
ncbi:ABC transporter substrate-binding protein [Sesbania bispinosa]|nr:ABC transporter substrate-binding protein [Sesbania bispinosa]